MGGLLAQIIMNITGATYEVVAEYPYIENYLSKKLVNYRALARDIRPRVATKIGREVNIQSIVTALRRLSYDKDSKKEHVDDILSKSEISLRYDLALITVELTRYIHGKILELHRNTGDDGYLLLQGLESLTIVVKDSHLGFLEKLFKNSILKKIENLAGIVVKSPEDITDTPGVITRLTSLLSAENINIVEMMSSYSETFLLVEEGDALACIEAIRREMKRARSLN